jgi:Holliday junction DNA helicase RuvA
MIEFVRGRIVARDPSRLVLDIGPMGLGIDVPSSVSLTAGAIGSECTLYTLLLVREDALQLVGFATDTQKRMFQALTSVSGIGPKVALRVLGEIEPHDLAEAIVRGDTPRLTKVSGIGKKTAEVLVAHLRDAMAKSTGKPLSRTAPVLSSTPVGGGNVLDAILALQALGMDPVRSENAVRAASAELGPDVETSRLVAQALRKG